MVTVNIKKKAKINKHITKKFHSIEFELENLRPYTIIQSCPDRDMASHV